MRSNLSFIKTRMAQTLSAVNPEGGGGRGTALTLFWTVTEGGELNPSTGALVGGTPTIYSGTMSAIAVQEIPRNVLRQYQEIQAGDLIVDCLPDPDVTVFAEQSPISGTIPLSVLANSGVQFMWNEDLYVQKQVGENLASIWALTIEGVELTSAILLRRQT